jgi:hypothetical protein
MLNKFVQKNVVVIILIAIVIVVWFVAYQRVFRSPSRYPTVDQELLNPYIKNDEDSKHEDSR